MNIPPKTSLSACTDASRAILHDSPFPTGMAIPYLARIGNLGESLYATSPVTPNALGVEPSAFYPLVSFNFHTYKIKFQWYQIMGPRVDSDSVEKIGRYSIMRGSDLSLFVSANLRDFSLFRSCRVICFVRFFSCKTPVSNIVFHVPTELKLVITLFKGRSKYLFLSKLSTNCRFSKNKILNYTI